MSPPTTVIAVLAAGASRRMGEPKLALPVGGKPLLLHVVDRALAAAAGPVVVVLGASAELYEALLGATGVARVVNAEWEEGIASSVRAAVRMARERSAASLLIMLADQPGVSAAHLQALVRAVEDGAPAAATEYEFGLAPPALYPRALWEQLERVRGDAGARAVLRSVAGVVGVPAAWPADDIDDASDYLRFTARE